MTREKLLEHICPTKNIDLCCSGATKIDCIDCQNVMNTYLGEYDKHVIAQYEAEHGNLADTIREIHDCVAKEMYCKGIDDFANWLVEQGILGRHSSLYKEFLKTGHFKNRKYKFSLLFDEEKKKDVESNIRVFLFDATDSGLSIDSIIEIKTMFDNILADSKKNGLETYIIISANEYELCRNSNCFDVNEGKYITFEDYENYRKFIINSRAKKEKRIEKQLQWMEKKKAKEGRSDSDVRDYCAENNIPYRLAQDFMNETYKYLDNNDIDEPEI